MILPDYERTRVLLLDTGDTEIAKLVRVLDAVLRSAKFRPLATTTQREAELTDAVRESFLTPFARKFLGWVDLDDELTDTLEQLATGGADPARGSRLEQRARLRFRNALLEIETCWRQIVHFMPFILMATLRRLDDDALRKYAGEELAQALHYYNTFYGRYDTERQREADQLHLLVYLIRVFRKLRRSAGLDESALFATTIGRTASGFLDLFPDRFDAGMRLLQQVRNRVIHGRVADRLPIAVLPEVSALVKWCFLDVIAVLEPICRTYSLNYVTDLSVGSDEAVAETLDFTGSAGPLEGRYRISVQPQVESFTFTRHRLYLILRAKRLGGGSGEVLGPPDYLDLTPFLITDQLRQGSRNAQHDDRQRLLFALQQYLEPVRRLLFADLGGSGDNARPVDANDWEANRLLEQIQWFKDRIGQLTAKVRVRTGSPIDAHSLRTLLWRVSRDSLAPLMEVRLYDEAGNIVPDTARRDLKAVYDRELFVEPREGAAITSFLASERRALLLVGGSGFGKSNLLVHHYLGGLRERRLSVFLGGRRFETAEFRDVLVTAIAREISRDWDQLAHLDAYLEETGETLLIFIDAVNEFSGPGGPLRLLDDMISAIHRDPALRRCKIVATCRAESWARYRQEFGEDKPLDPAIFASNDGDALKVGGFDDPERGQLLFEAYRRFYGLLPERYDRLSPVVRALIGQPFLMAIVAETYSNRDPGPDTTAKVSIPPDLDYFSIFESLTERKGRDAQVLVPTDDRLARETLPASIRAFCKSLAEIVYERLTTADKSDALVSGLDSVPLDVIDKRANLQEFVQRRGPISVLDATLQTGIVEQVRIQQRDWEGRLTAGTAVSFFHDQYAQYWLAAAYQHPIIGWLDGKRLGSPGEIDAIVARIREIIEQATHAPILAGALDHWIQKNLVNFHRKKLDPLIPLLDRMASDIAPAVRYQVVVILASLMLRGFLTPKSVFDPVFRIGSERLRLELANVFVEFWPALPPRCVQDFIDCCHPDRDRAVLDKLGDIFVLHLPQEPGLVVDYLNDAIRPLSWGSITEPMRIWRQSRFMQQFGVFGFITNFDQPDCVEAMRRFFRAKYRPVIDLFTGSNMGSGINRAARQTLRGVLFRKLEDFGVDQWDKYIGYLEPSGNSHFFEEYEGVNQHDLLRQLLPYLVELHNGDFTRLTLEPGSEFRALLLRMLDFRVMSVIGYNALLCLPSVLSRVPWEVTEALVMELIERRSESTLFYGNLLLANISYSDPALAGPCLTLIRDRIVPFLVRESLACDWSIAFCIATLDTEGLWPIQAAILDQLFAAAEVSDDPEAPARLGEALYKMCYTHDIRLGRKLLEKLIADQDRFLGPRWRPVTLKVLAAMLIRGPTTLYAVIRGAGAAESLVGEARANRTTDMVEQSRLFPFQADINRFVAWLYVDEPRLRRAVIKHFIGSLACGGSIRDFAIGVRQTVVALMTVFAGEEPENVPAGPLTVEEIEASVAATRRYGNARTEGA